MSKAKSATKYVVGNQDNPTFDVRLGRRAIVVRSYFYNGEHHYKLRDEVTSEVFDSPACFWAYTIKK